MADTPPVDATQPADPVAPIPEGTPTEEVIQEDTPPPDIYDEIVTAMSPDSYQGTIISDDERANLIKSTDFFRCGQRAFINDLVWALASKNNEYRLSKNELDWLFYNHEKHATKAFSLFATSYKEVACAEVFEEMCYEPFSETDAQKLSETIKTNREFFKKWGVTLTLKTLTRLPLGLPPTDASEEEPPVLIPTETSLLKYTSDYRAMARVLDAYVAHGYEEEAIAFLTAVKTQAPDVATKIKSRMQHHYEVKGKVLADDGKSGTVTLSWLGEDYPVAVTLPEVPPAQPGQLAPTQPPRLTSGDLDTIAGNLADRYHGEDLAEAQSDTIKVGEISYIVTTQGGQAPQPVVPPPVIVEPPPPPIEDDAIETPKLLTDKITKDDRTIKIEIKTKKPEVTIKLDIGGIPKELTISGGPTTKTESITLSETEFKDRKGQEIQVKITHINDVPKEYPVGKIKFVDEAAPPVPPGPGPTPPVGEKDPFSDSAMKAKLDKIIETQRGSYNNGTYKCEIVGYMYITDIDKAANLYAGNPISGFNSMVYRIVPQWTKPGPPLVYYVYDEVDLGITSVKVYTAFNVTGSVTPLGNEGRHFTWKHAGKISDQTPDGKSLIQFKSNTGGVKFEKVPGFKNTFKVTWYTNTVVDKTSSGYSSLAPDSIVTSRSNAATASSFRKAAAYLKSHS